MSGVELKVAREGYDVTTAADKDFALDSDRFLPKIYKVKRVDPGADPADEVTIDHDLTYPPRGITYVEVDDSPLIVAYQTQGINADDNNVYVTPGVSLDYSTSPYSATNNTGSYVLLMLDPLGTPGIEPTPLSGDQPIVRVGGEDGDPDYKRKIHSYYDSLKVFLSGTMTIEAPAIDFGDDDNHWYTATVDHNLGYIPMFSPFVNYSIELNAHYQWSGQWYGRGAWSTGREFGPGMFVTNGGDSYEGTHFNTSAAINEPGVGADWEDYWELYSSTIPEWATGTIYDIGDRIYNNHADWATGTAYTIVDYVYNNGQNYTCILNHTAGAANEPGVGGSWTTYWVGVDRPDYYCYVAHTSGAITEPEVGVDWEDKWWRYTDDGIPDEIIVNDLEQPRIVFGGVFAFLAQAIYFYATTTQIVMKYLRRGYEWPGGGIDAKFEKRIIKAHYTIFYNRIDEDMNILDEY